MARQTAILAILADENIPRPVVRALREAGFDVQEVATLKPGEADPGVLRQAGRMARLLLTADRDFGALVYALRSNAPVGVIYMRLGALRLAAVAERLCEVLRNKRYTFAGQFTVVEPGRVRQRPLPKR